MKKKRITGRRDFLKKTAIGVGGTIMAPTILNSCAKRYDDHIRLAHIGVGSHGGSNLTNYFLPLEATRSVAICDVWKDRRNNWTDYANEFYKDNNVKAPNVEAYLDFEEILQRDDIDAVVINTPDHWHVPAAIKSARAGKHVFLAKPLGLSYPNFKILEKEIAANNVRFHYGTQQRAQEHMQLAVSMIKEGEIGEIEKVLVWCPGINPVPNPICIEVPPPIDFDYDKWTGPAPFNHFCPDRVTNNSSWFQYDYSIGFLAGWGAHPLDVVVWAIRDKVDGIYSCEGTGGFWDDTVGIYNNVKSWDLNYKYKNGPELHFVSLDVAEKKGLLEDKIMKYKRESVNGTTFYGSKGMITISRNGANSDIPELNQKLIETPISGANRMGQMFADAIIGGKSKETCPLDEAIISDTISHMGDMAIRRNHRVTWDPQQGKVIDDDQANSLYIRHMRHPYTV
jgi:hypothetical protein